LSPAERPARILVCDDDRAVRSALTVNLGKAGYVVVVCDSAEEGLERLRAEPFDVVLTDVKMTGMTGLQLLTEIRTHWPDTRVVVMTGFGSVSDAVGAMKAGASDYLIKPIGRDELLLLLKRALENRALAREVQRLRLEVDSRYGFESIVGVTPVMQELYEQVNAVADSSTLVLVHGETGTGKELIAHAIHYRSPRARAPLVVVNCGALPENLLESELFGHEKGAFTGAMRTHQGKFEQADGGTLFLDEIGEIPPSVQVRLLRVLEGGSFTRVGGERPVKVDVRVIAATNRDLRAEVRAGSFRADLFYRLNVFPIRLPPLRERVDDIPLLAETFLRRFAERHQRVAPRLHPEAIESLRSWRWPGNVRELEHLMERSLLLSGGGGEIRSFRLPDEREAAAPAQDAASDDPLDQLDAGGLPALLDRWERGLIVAALEAEGGVQARAARRLGISRSNLNYRIGRLGITLQDVKFA
jgi:DNA-binding NtrC family response regulator